mmetsp:Transcript_12893/g.35688  ORF Transcript_12893/g.35688 Transcript_12893/m.35688 type:complete len:206 (-) Transcript_12893:190-807(-)
MVMLLLLLLLLIGASCPCGGMLVLGCFGHFPRIVMLMLRVRWHGMLLMFPWVHWCSWMMRRMSHHSIVLCSCATHVVSPIPIVPVMVYCVSPVVFSFHVMRAIPRCVWRRMVSVLGILIIVRRGLWWWVVAVESGLLMLMVLLWVLRITVRSMGRHAMCIIHVSSTTIGTTCRWSYSWNHGMLWSRILNHGPASVSIMCLWKILR